MGSVLIQDVILAPWIRTVPDHPPSGKFLMVIFLEEPMSVIYQTVCIFCGKSIDGVDKFLKFQNSKNSKKSKKLKKFKINKIKNIFPNIAKNNIYSKNSKTVAKPRNRGKAPACHLQGLE